MTRRKRQGGSAMIEFAFTGIPLIFIWISMVYMALGMWDYHTLQYAVKQAGAYVSVHGSATGYCKANVCRVEDAANVMAKYAIGIPPAAISMTFTPITESVTHTTQGASTACLLNACQTNATSFPGGNPEFIISASFYFAQAMGMWAPGSKPVSFKNQNLPAYTHQYVVF